MGIRDSVPLLDRIDGYEQASLGGILLTMLGSTMAWLTLEANAEAAAQLDDIDPGTTTFTGFDLGFGVFTFGLGLLAALVLGLVLWRYRGAGRKTGLVVMLVGFVTFAVAVVGIVLTGVLIGQAGELEGVTVDTAGGILLTLIGAVVMLGGGALRLAAGAETPEASVGDEPRHEPADGSAEPAPE